MAGAIVLGVGASAGLSGALCRRIAREGLHVLAAGRTQAKLASVVDEISGAGGRAASILCDVTREPDVLRPFDLAGAAPELVVYNAGNAMIRPLLEMDAAFRGGLASRLPRRFSRRPGVRAAHGSRGRNARLHRRDRIAARASAVHCIRRREGRAARTRSRLAREFNPQGLHVAHVIVDGMIEGDQSFSRFPAAKERAGEDGLLRPEAIADAYWALHAQPRSAWTLELDLRPFQESF
jgi:hypothetical protein